MVLSSKKVAGARMCARVNELNRFFVQVVKATFFVRVTRVVTSYMRAHM